MDIGHRHWNGGYSVAVLAIFIACILLSTTFVELYACFNPADLSAIEVLINKPSAGYNLTVLLNEFRPIVVVDGGKLYVFKYVYRTIEGRDLSFGVSVYLERFCSGAPCIEGYNEEVPISYVLGLRMEPLEPCSTGEKNSAVAEQICMERQRSVINLVFANLLKALIDRGVLTGLDLKDYYTIMDAVIGNPIVAGWNSRLMYSDALGGWAPYGELVAKGYIRGVLLRSSGCSYTVPQNVSESIKISQPSLLVEESPLPTVTPTPVPSPTTVTHITTSTIPVTVTSTIEVVTTTTVVGRTTETATVTITPPVYSDGNSVAVAIAIGVATALAIYIVFRRVL